MREMRLSLLSYSREDVEDYTDCWANHIIETGFHEFRGYGARSQYGDKAWTNRIDRPPSTTRGLSDISVVREFEPVSVILINCCRGTKTNKRWDFF